MLECPKPVIAAVDGVAYGAGFGMALCADVLIATPAARFCLSFMRVGLVPDFASAFTLPRIVGWQRAKQLIYTAAEISGTQAHDWGIAAELCPSDKLAQRATEVARAMTHLPPTAFAMTKQMLLRAFTTEVIAAGEAEANAQGVAFTTDYHHRAVEQLMAREPLEYNYPKA
jgi:enoyl-CoA hydratase/carnithine racemase